MLASAADTDELHGAGPRGQWHEYSFRRSVSATPALATATAAELPSLTRGVVRIRQQRPLLGGSLKSSFLVVGRNPFGHSEPISLATTTGTTFAIAVIVLAVPIEVEQVEKV